MFTFTIAIRPDHEDPCASCLLTEVLGDILHVVWYTSFYRRVKDCNRVTRMPCAILLGKVGRREMSQDTGDCHVDPAMRSQIIREVIVATVLVFSRAVGGSAISC